MIRAAPWLVDPLEFHQQKPAAHWRVVEVGDAEHYQRGHIPGAMFLPWQALMHNGPPSPGLLPQTQQLQAILAHLNHQADAHYWVYDHEGGGWAGRLLWLLEVLGHHCSTYLNGGKLAWQAEGLPLDVGAPPRGTADGSAGAIITRPQELVGVEELMQALNSDSPPTIWDARSTGEYRGLMHSARRNGHIPGAIHCEWTELMNPAQGYRIRSDALEYLDAKGLTVDRPIVTHCQSHHRSGFTYLVGKCLSMNIRAYAGAWAEWGNRPDTPIVGE